MTMENEVEVARFYTRARRFPKQIGRTLDGAKIPGGPYSILQFTLGVSSIIVLVATRQAWGLGSIFFDFPVAAGLGWGVALITGRIPATRRNVLFVAWGAIAAAFAPPVGRYRDATIQIPKPHRAHGSPFLFEGRVLVPATSSAVPATQPPVSPPAAEVDLPTVPEIQEVAPQPQPNLVTSRPVSGVERLLAQTRATK